jgi:uridine kinase
MPFYDRYHRETIPDAVNVEFAANDVLVIEGVVALMSEPLLMKARKRIYLSCPETIRWQNFQQEYHARGLPTAEITALYQSRLVDENPIVETVKPRADAVITELYQGAANAIN